MFLYLSHPQLYFPVAYTPALGSAIYLGFYVLKGEDFLWEGGMR